VVRLTAKKSVILLKNDEIINFSNMNHIYTDFSALEMFKLQYQFSNIVETSQTTQ